jgi:putative cell wall-binding protein
VIGRAAGATRYETAIAASARVYSPKTSRDVVLATGERFPDALASAGLAGALGCPVLLTPRASIPPAVLSEIARLGATDVHIVGGRDAVSDGIRNRLNSLGYKTYRYAGLNRYETSAVVADAVLSLRRGKPALAFVARGDDYADALSVSPIAYQHAYPILLTGSSGLSPSVRAALGRSRPGTILVAGETVAVPAGVFNELRALSYRPKVIRVGGLTRYETATGFANYSFSNYLAVPDHVGVVNGTRFPDAVVGGPGIGARGGVLLLTQGETLNGSARSSLQSWERNGLVDNLVIYGGTAAVSRTVQDQITAVFR